MILQDYYLSYKECADTVDWRNQTVSELCDNYIKHEKDILKANAYLSAIVLKYWNKISFYFQKGYPVVTAEQAYEWVVDSIQNTLKNRPWLDEQSKLYQDSNAPDKCINVGILHERANWYQATNRDKRVLNYTIKSLDEMKEEINYEEKTFDNTEDNITRIDKDVVLKYFIRKEYFISFLVDIICNYDCYKLNREGKYVLNKHKLNKHLLDIKTDEYIKHFSDYYDIDEKQVRLAADLIVLKPSMVQDKIKRSLYQLKHDDIIHLYRGY